MHLTRHNPGDRSRVPPDRRLSRRLARCAGPRSRLIVVSSFEVAPAKRPSGRLAGPPARDTPCTAWPGPRLLTRFNVRWCVIGGSTHFFVGCEVLWRVRVLQAYFLPCCYTHIQVHIFPTPQRTVQSSVCRGRRLSASGIRGGVRELPTTPRLPVLRRHALTVLSGWMLADFADGEDDGPRGSNGSGPGQQRLRRGRLDAALGSRSGSITSDRQQQWQQHKREL